MAGNCVFQLSPTKPEDDGYVTSEYLINEGFVTNVASYVYEPNTDADRLECIKSFVEELDNKTHCITFNEKEGYIMFKSGFKYEYFYPKYNLFNDIVSKIGIDDFIHDSNSLLSALQKSIEETFDVPYIVCEDCGPESLDYFIRNRMKLNTRYYVVSVVNYHI